MTKFGEWIAKHRVFIVIICLLLLIPSLLGIFKTNVNYDLLSYLPDSLETVEGQNLMVDEFGTGAFSMVVIENMEMKDIEKVAETIEGIDHVQNVVWYGSLADISIPTELMPEKLYSKLFNGDATLMVVFYDNTTSAATSMQAVTDMRNVLNKQCFISGMTGVVTDIKNICLAEIPIYVVIAAVLDFIVLELVTDSFLVPVFFLLSIGLAVLYNMGTNVFLGEVSYITQALLSVLQLAVTTDYSIFLLESFEECKEIYPEDRNKAMGEAIARTFRSIVSSSITTVAGFIALCVMTYALGMNIGLVMSKGVVIGVICCVTFLPAMILIFDKPIQKTKHRRLIRNLDGISGFVTKHSWVWLIIFALIAGPALYGNDHNDISYNIAGSLPDTIESNIANKKLQETFDMTNMHILLFDKDMTSRDKANMLEEIEKVDGVNWVLGLNSVVSSSIPQDMLPTEITSELQSDKHEMAMVCSSYEAATDEVNTQIATISEIVKRYDPNGMVIGEAPLMKDLQDTTDVDLQRVNILSIAAIFIIILLTFKSAVLPVILLLVIEFAINVNMAVPYFMGSKVSFVASIVIGTIQLGATVDYAILMTNRYVLERKAGKNKKEAVSIAHRSCILSILTSGISFFVATFGVAAYSQVEIISSICMLLSRGALISMVAVITILPAMFLLFDPIIIRTTAGFGDVRRAEAENKKNKGNIAREGN